ncbi:hypothetical protein [Streptomyces sp. HB132]|uniref:hypothetical protein n=1 Tax=Streptomyces sp. HB132 TaxID=767388 RepID=UPI00195F4147|nr:hypothetical protein [Streptomyces sp. HB132]MBM7440593.1 hypothetical protein [Streptomyces sp. HB132]
MLAAAAAFSFLGANAAVAADYKMTTLGHFIVPGGTMEFTKYGDIVKVCDTDADGMAAKGWVKEAGGGTRYSLQAGGNGKCVTKRASMGGAYDIPEGGTHEFLVCLHTSSDDGYCNRQNWKNNG